METADSKTQCPLDYAAFSGYLNVLSEALWGLNARGNSGSDAEADVMSRIAVMRDGYPEFSQRYNDEEESRRQQIANGAGGITLAAI